MKISKPYTTLGGTIIWRIDNEYGYPGDIHREDGPAIEYTDGNNSWYINGYRINCKSQEEFERLLKLKAFW